MIESGRLLVCVDSYDNGILAGRLENACREMEAFSSLSQFLVKVEEMLHELQQPQSFTEPRTFSLFLRPDEAVPNANRVRKGLRATFELQVLFRQHSSWQGHLRWREENAEHSFRSALELVLLMDSALRSPEGSGAA